VDGIHGYYLGILIGSSTMIGSGVGSGEGSTSSGICRNSTAFSRILEI
jgi:hypothetical protein